ncbi:MAG: hypothetical protein HYX93_06845 [Chloroflexi bacterium]|nr:hypothetical protein [Chloroflexota bacterium]
MTYYRRDNPGPELPLLFSSQLEGQTQAHIATHMGFEYPGEVIVASRWSEGWGKELALGRYFRVVLLTTRQRLSNASLEDARIVVCVPAQDVIRRRESLDRDLKSIAEAREMYTAGRQATPPGLRSALEQREAELRADFLQGCSLSYGAGQVLSTLKTGIALEGIFATPDPERWLNGLAEATLAQVYPTLPVNPAAFSRALGSEDMAALFDGFLGDVPQAPPNEVTRAFAVGLSLAHPDHPSTFNPQGHPVFDLVLREMEAQGGSRSVSDLARLLGNSYGLPLPLVALFLLALVKYDHPEVELDLAPESKVATPDGTPFSGDRITWDMVGYLGWRENLWETFTYIHRPEPPTWNTALPLIRMLNPEAERIAPQAAPPQETALFPALRELTRDAQQALSDIQPFVDVGEMGQVAVRLQALVELGQSADFRQFYERCRENCPGPRSLARERHLPAQVRQLRALLPEIATTRSYLEEITFGPGDTVMAVDHEALVHETRPDHILANLSLWPAVKERFDHLFQRYRSAYIRHHEQYRKEASGLWSRMQQALPLVLALEQLNTIPELGLPVGEELSYQFDELNTSLKMCSAPEAEVPLDASPLCPYCGLRLSEQVPHQEIEAVLVDIGQALQEQTRRLSLHGVQQILERRDEEMVDKLVKIVGIADLSPLANVLNPQVMAFLRAFLAGR